MFQPIMDQSTVRTIFPMFSWFSMICLAGFDERPDLFAQLPEHPCLHRRRAAAERAADETEVLRERLAQVNGRFAAAKRGDENPAATMRHFVEIFAETFAADTVENDVRRIGVQYGADVFRLAVDDDVRSDFAGGFRLAVVTDSRDNLCAPSFCKLCRGNAEAAGPCLDENGVSRLDARFELKVQKTGGIDFGQGGRLDHRDAFRDGQQHGAVNGDFFRIAATAEQRADRVADLPAADSVGPDGFHDTGNFQPHPFR